MINHLIDDVKVLIDRPVIRAGMDFVHEFLAWVPLKFMKADIGEIFGNGKSMRTRRARDTAQRLAPSRREHAERRSSALMCPLTARA